jgi:guanine deaminase
MMNAMRQAVITSRLREGARVEAEEDAPPRSVDWKETLFLATKGGYHALGASGGVFEVGAPFDAQLSQ